MCEILSSPNGNILTLFCAVDMSFLFSKEVMVSG